MNDALLFTTQQREQIRAQLVATAKADARIAGAAYFGSAALGAQDRWSDIDLGLCVTDDAHLDQVLIDWTARLYRDHAAVAHYDVRRGHILYRVFLLENTLQIDLSFWPATELHAVGPKFRLIFGVAGEPAAAPVPDAKDLIGMAWLYALHVRSSIARSRFLQAENMLSGMRNNVLALMRKRQGVSAAQGRVLDDLAEERKTRAAESLARSLEPAELHRAFRVTMDALLEELRCAESGLAAKVERPLNTIVTSLTSTV